MPAPSEASRAAETPMAPPAPRAPESGPPADAQPPAQALPRAGAAQPAPAQPAPAQPAPAQRAPAAAAPAGQPAEPALAQWWRRLLAFVIDAVVLTLATGALWGRLLASFANRMSQAVALHSAHSPTAHGAYGRVFGHTAAPYLIVLAPTIVAAVLYYWLLTGYWGTTIGKRVLGTWVVRAADQSWVGLRLSFVRALVFAAGAEVVPLFFLADNLWLTGDSRRQALHDKAARTLVVTTRPVPRQRSRGD